MAFFGMSDFARADQGEEGEAKGAVFGTEKDVQGADLFGTTLSHVMRAAQKQQEAEQGTEQEIKEYYFDVPAEASYRGKGMTAVRSAPALNAKVIRFLTKEDTVRVIGECTVGMKVWYLVWEDEYRGYLGSENVELSMRDETDFDPFPEESIEEEATEPSEEESRVTETETQDPWVESLALEALQSEEAEKERAQAAVLAAAMEAAYGIDYVPEEMADERAEELSEGEQKLQEIEEQLAGQDLTAPGSEEQQFQAQAMQLQAEILRAALQAAGTSGQNSGGNFLQAENAMREQKRRAEEARREAERKAAIAFKQAIADGAKVAAGTKGREIADFAAAWVGRIHYGFGCNQFSEGGYVDCSHFTFNVFKEFGLAGEYVNSWGQRSWGREVSESEIRPGDLVCYNGHVAIYFGCGIIVHAPSPGKDVMYDVLTIGPRYCIRRLCD